jgi:hypothetical protein
VITRCIRRQWLVTLILVGLVGPGMPLPAQETPSRGGQITMALETDPGTLSPTRRCGG